MKLVGLAVGAAPGVFAGESALSPPDVFVKCAPSVVTLHVLTESGQSFVASGFVVSTGGVAATAWHVVHDAAAVRATLPDGGECRMLKLLGRDEAHDLALIALERTDLPALEFAKETPRVGSRVYTIGAPRGYEFSFVEGMLNQVREIDAVSHYQVSCPISRGNSGGPLLNAHGEVTGLISWSKKNAQNVSFAVPSGFLKALLANTETPDVTDAGHPTAVIPVPLATSTDSSSQIKTETREKKGPAIGSGSDKDPAEATKGAMASSREETSNRSFDEVRQYGNGKRLIGDSSDQAE